MSHFKFHEIHFHKLLIYAERAFREIYMYILNLHNSRAEDAFMPNAEFSSDKLRC